MYYQLLIKINNDDINYNNIIIIIIFSIAILISKH